VRSLGAESTIALRPKDLAIYHTISVFSANLPVLLGVAVEELSEAIGQSPTTMKRALAPLVEQVLLNILSGPALQALSGPIRRGDVETIGRHRQALLQLDPTLWKIYDGFLAYARQNQLFGEASEHRVSPKRRSGT
jgi:predicted short-subunit dehydrogenase-like oxidoreductase (DUF2520 family)